MKFIDIGINLTNRQFQNDIKIIIKNAVDAGVEQMILTGTSVKNSEQSSALAKKYPGILFATAGLTTTGRFLSWNMNLRS